MTASSAPPPVAIPLAHGDGALFRVTVPDVSNDDLEAMLDTPEDDPMTDEPPFNALRRAAARGLIKPPSDGDTSI